MNNDIKTFLNSNLSEAEYYSLSKENLITIRDYLLQLKDKDTNFNLAIQNQFESIKKKCGWLSFISFGGLIHESGNYELTAIYLYSKDGVDLIAKYNYANNKYEGLVQNVTKLYLISKKVRKHLNRQNDIDLIQKELYEIENIGRNIYKEVLRPISSVSGNFHIYYTPHFGLSIYNEYDLIANYLTRSTKRKEKEYLKDEISKEKLLKKILINSNKKQ